MQITESKLTIFFEHPFWVGLYERQDTFGYEVCKITFGAEPKEGEVYAFFLRHWRQLPFQRLSNPYYIGQVDVLSKNPKRIQREIHKMMGQRPISTKAQQALQALYEERKQEKRRNRSRKKQEKSEDRFQRRKKR